MNSGELSRRESRSMGKEKKSPPDRPLCIGASRDKGPRCHVNKSRDLALERVVAEYRVPLTPPSASVHRSGSYLARVRPTSVPNHPFKSPDSMGTLHCTGHGGRLHTQARPAMTGGPLAVAVAHTREPSDHEARSMSIWRSLTHASSSSHTTTPRGFGRIGCLQRDSVRNHHRGIRVW